MAKLKLTKNELKRQKDDLKRFRRYLPTLQLKKQQLQSEIMKLYRAVEKIEEDIKIAQEKLEKWVDVFAEEAGISELIKIKEIKVSEGNIAGSDIPIFESVEFDLKEYDYLTTPIWVDRGIEAVKERIAMIAQIKVLYKQLEIIREELRITTQRVNLFEKVKIPEAVENIRKIRIFLGDLQTAAVITGKIAKHKIESREEVLV